MESLLAEVALPLSYAGNWSRRLDSNQQHTITHELRPITMKAGKGRWWMLTAALSG